MFCTDVRETFKLSKIYWIDLQLHYLLGLHLVNECFYGQISKFVLFLQDMEVKQNK